MSLSCLDLRAGIQAYLQQCWDRGCSALLLKAEPPPVVVELLYHINMRLLKQGVRGITNWQPHTPQPVGLHWLLQPFRRSQDPSLAEPFHYQQTRGDRLSQGPSHQPHLSSDRRKALYTSDGLTMSSRLLDSVIVQAFVEPLVYDTVAALGTTHKHSIPAQDWREILSQHQGVDASPPLVQSEGEVLWEEERRSFRVELMLLDVPPQLVGRSFGFVQLLLMVEYGWVAMGLYRDKRTHSGADTSHDGAAPRSDYYTSPSTTHSPYFVFTNPPPAVILEGTDRIYTLVQRWLSVDTAEAVLRQRQSATEPSAAGEPPAEFTVPSSPLTCPPIPSSYSPRMARHRPTPALSVRTDDG